MTLLDAYNIWPVIFAATATLPQCRTLSNTNGKASLLKQDYVRANVERATCRLTVHAGLLCLRTAKEGGLTSWSSSGAIYNRMLESHPEFVKVNIDFALAWHATLPSGEIIGG